MSLQVEMLEKGMAKLTIEVSADEFEKAVDKVYKKNRSKMNIQGFRRGKAPRHIIEKMYGAEVFFEDGNLNRKALASKIYSENSAREELNKLTFKYVVDEMLLRIKQITLNETNIKIVVIDAPLLLEAGLDKVCDYVVALVADKELKIKRICQRDNIDEKTAESRLNIQNDDKFYTDKADFVIVNSKNCDLKNEIEKVLKEI